MANLTEQDFIRCTPTQYKKGITRQIDEIISLEQAFTYSYNCKHGEHNYSGTREIYAYPHKIDELIIGHVILDQIPCYSSDFTYELNSKDNKYELILNAADKASPPHEPCKGKLDLDELVNIMHKVLSAEGKWDGTGCFHRAALYHPTTKKLILAEDIGRHNCVDRLKGHSIIHNLPIQDYFLFITARITSSLYHKIQRAGIKTIVSRSAITSTAYLSAINDNCTLAAFCRPEDERVTLFNNSL